jgi:hypothetical protein
MDRSTVGRALDAMIDEEEGMPFQGLAVQLAQRRCPSLIACEREKDLGLDACASGATTADGVGIGSMRSSVSGSEPPNPGVNPTRQGQASTASGRLMKGDLNLIPSSLPTGRQYNTKSEEGDGHELA